MCTYCLGSGNDFFISSIQITITDVIHDRAGENEAVLHHNTHLLTQGGESYLGDIRTINGNCTGVNIVESADQIYNCGFTGACRSYNSIGITGLGSKVHIVQNLYTVFIAEAYILEAHFPLDWRHWNCIRGILDIDRFINCLKDSLQISNGSQQGIIERSQCINRFPESGDIGGEGNQYTYCNSI